ncbi:unnamed protein product [Chondrus crispus]|uniref:Uncharacterized protein n=1 Tax=Chondrus crispus TaxID=2769 RepID=R7QE78_CHOCR|nr:unnamed protein product [Chondrus crispus]CDF36817.1 unnamed protein product [Chondrus crispus]|eukprot:XP_005716636.1 unnamed protein product [Chondrus crispus]
MQSVQQFRVAVTSLIKEQQSKTASNVSFASYESKILPCTRPLQRLLLDSGELKIAIKLGVPPCEIFS